MEKVYVMNGRRYETMDHVNHQCDKSGIHITEIIPIRTQINKQTVLIYTKRAFHQSHDVMRLDLGKMRYLDVVIEIDPPERATAYSPAIDGDARVIGIYMVNDRTGSVIEIYQYIEQMDMVKAIEELTIYNPLKNQHE